jgi:integrase
MSKSSTGFRHVSPAFLFPNHLPVVSGIGNDRRLVDEPDNATGFLSLTEREGKGGRKMGSIRRRGKRSWQIDYFEPPTAMEKRFDDEDEARRAFDRVWMDEDRSATLEFAEGLAKGQWLLSYTGRKRVRLNIRGTKKEAQAELAKRVSMIVEDPKRYLEIKERKSYTFDELVERYRDHFRDQTAYHTGKAHHVDLVAEEFKGRPLDSITYYDCEAYKLKRKRTPTRHESERAASTLNKEVGTLRHMFNKAVEWEMIDQSPLRRGRSLQEKVNNKRTRFLSEEEIRRLLAECNPWLEELVIVAINTGMRRGEILSLKWSQIRNDFIHLEKTKTDEARQIPIIPEVDAIFKARRKRIQLKSEYVFCHEVRKTDRKGNLLLYQPVGDISNAFDSAVKRADIEHCRFHDLRHTFASHLIMRGRTPKEIQELLGHKDISMTMRYAHLADKHKVEAIHALSGLTSGNLKKGQKVDNNVDKIECHNLSQNGRLEGVGDRSWSP